MTTITFLTDFGLDDDFVGICHGVIARIAPEARVIDVTHGIAPQAVLQGALVLRNAVPYLPVGVHLAVVDPGVGGRRRAVAVRTRDGRVFVGPDNGLLLLAADELVIDAAYELTEPRFRLSHVSRTFHARDVFAPAAAHVAAGVPLEQLGPALDPATLVRVEVPATELDGASVVATALLVDRFGNVATGARREHLEALGVRPGDAVLVRVGAADHAAVAAETFAEAAPGALLVYEDSHGLVTVAVANGSAAAVTGLGPGQRVAIERA